jgi:HSP20 family protein
MSRSLAPWDNRLGRTFDRLESEMSGLMRRFFGEEPGLSTLSNAGSLLTPLINVAETEAGYEITAELPGVKPEDLNVEYREGALVISGHKAEENEEKGKTFHRVERYAGEFRRVIALPQTVDQEHVEANYTNGVLRVSVPKAEAAKPRQINIKTS